MCHQSEYDKRIRGPVCECCGLGDLRVLVRKQIDKTRWQILCANCAKIADGQKMTIEELRAEVIPDDDRRAGDRRLGLDRRWGKRRRDRRRLWPRENEPERRKGVRRRVG
ncbi:MAG: hypothetical protein GY847_25420 [Proteobacteria bacterium]|nr:hypothetical protein [Pseudomonadota bacterium]